MLLAYGIKFTHRPAGAPSIRDSQVLCALYDGSTKRRFLVCNVNLTGEHRHNSPPLKLYAEGRKELRVSCGRKPSGGEAVQTRWLRRTEKEYDERVAKRTALTSVRTSRQRSSIPAPLVLAFPKTQTRVYKSKECIYVEASPMQAYA